MPQTPNGTCRLAGALREVDEQPEHPVTVWWWDVDGRTERRGTLYGWRDGPAGRVALVVARGPVEACSVTRRDCVRWVPAHLTRTRAE